MYTIEKYLANVKKLTNSLVIKLHSVALNNNIGILNNENFTKDHLPNEDKTNWKYYLNISGQYHPLDKKVKINVIETEKEEILTLELLEKYPLTKAELLRCGDFYNELLILNPLSLTFIHGCMYPVKIEDAINAECGTILNYNSSYVERNESYLIKELEKYIKNLLHRWYIKEYSLVDELYVPAFVGFLYGSIYNKILNLHLSKVLTNEVNSFHLEHFFRSRLDLWEDVQILNKESLYWLYKNLNSLIANVGQTSNLDKIIYKLLDMNNIGVGEFKLLKQDPSFNKNMYDLTRPSFSYGEPTFITKKLNKHYIVNDNLTSSVESVIDSQLTRVEDVKNKLPANMRNYVSEINKDVITDKIFSIEKTKTLDIDSVSLFKKSGLDLFSIVMDYWIYIISRDYMKIGVVEYPGNINKKENEGMAYENVVEEFISTDNRIYRVTPKVGLFMLIKLLLFSVNATDIKLKNLKYSRIINTDREIYEHIEDKLLIKDGYTQLLTNNLKKYHPLPFRNITKVDDFKKYLESIIEYSETLWLLGCNTENFITTANIKQMFSLLTMEGKYEISKEEKTIDDLLLEENVIFHVNQTTDVLKSIKLLIKTFTGIELDQDDRLIENMNKYISIIKKLSSYSIQVVNQNSLVKDIPVYYNNNTCLRTKHGLILLYGMNIKSLEPFKSRLWSRCVMYNEPVYINNIQYHPYMAKEKIKPIKGTFAIRNNYPEYFPTEPHHYYITKEPYFKFSNYKWYNDYVKVKAMEIQALEDAKQMKGKGVYSNHNDMRVFNLPSRTYLKAQKGIRGNLIVNEGQWLEKFQMFKMETIPNPWFQHGFTKMVTTMGMNLKALEVAKDFKFKHGITESRANIININRTNIYHPQDITGTLKISEPELIENIPMLGIPFKNRIYNIEYFKHKKYVKVSSMTFEALDKRSKNLKTVMFNGFFGKKKEDGSIESVEVRTTPLTDKVPFIRHNKVNGSGTIKDMNINKEYLLGVTSLIYEVDEIPSRISYVGLEDEEGNVDYYDTTKVPIIDREDLKLIPHLDIKDQILSGTSRVFETIEGKILNTKINLNENEILYPAIVEKKIEKANKPKLKMNNKPKVSYLGNNNVTIKKIKK